MIGLNRRTFGKDFEMTTIDTTTVSGNSNLSLPFLLLLGSVAGFALAVYAYKNSQSTMTTLVRVLAGVTGILALSGLVGFAARSGSTVEVNQRVMEQNFSQFLESDGYEFAGSKDGEFIWRNNDFERVVTYSYDDNLITADSAEMTLSQRVRKDRDPVAIVLRDRAKYGTPVPPVGRKGNRVVLVEDSTIDQWQTFFRDLKREVPRNMDDVRARKAEIEKYMEDTFGLKRDRNGDIVLD